MLAQKACTNTSEIHCLNVCHSDTIDMLLSRINSKWIIHSDATVCAESMWIGIQSSLRGLPSSSIMELSGLIFQYLHTLPSAVLESYFSSNKSGFYLQYVSRMDPQVLQVQDKDCSKTNTHTLRCSSVSHCQSFQQSFQWAGNIWQSLMSNFSIVKAVFIWGGGSWFCTFHWLLVRCVPCRAHKSGRFI